MAATTNMLFIAVIVPAILIGCYSSQNITVTIASMIEDEGRYPFHVKLVSPAIHMALETLSEILPSNVHVEYVEKVYPPFECANNVGAMVADLTCGVNFDMLLGLGKFKIKTSLYFPVTVLLIDQNVAD